MCSAQLHMPAQRWQVHSLAAHLDVVLACAQPPGGVRAHAGPSVHITALR